MKKLLISLLLVVLLFSQYQAFPNKIMASDLTWKCVGQDSFLVKLVVYTDCNGSALNSTPIIFSNALTSVEITRITIGIGTPVDVTPVCNKGCTRCQSSSCTFPYGIHRYTMQGIVKLNGAGSCCNVKLSWKQCCRNTSITTGAGGTNFYTEATLNRCLSPCDNSPTFTNMPVAIVCVGLDFIFSEGVQDVDINSTGGLADSLVFEWGEPLSEVSTPIAYTGSYSDTTPIFFWGFPNPDLPFPRGIHLNQGSGSIQFRPMKAEITVMSIKLSEYRNGVKIGELRREMQIIVIPCTNNNPPTISTPNNERSKSVCAGDVVSFDFSTNDVNFPDSLTISWNKAIPNAIWTNTNGISKHPTGRLTWTPIDADVNSLPYTFTVTVKDDACPVRGSFTQSYQITVKPRPRANIIVTDSGSGNYRFFAQRIEGAAPSYKWIGSNFSFQPDSGNVVSHKFGVGTYPYSMIMTAGGCSRTYYDTVRYDTTTNIIESRTTQSDFKIYPNPASDFVHIIFIGIQKWEGTLSIFDSHSKLILNQQLKFNQTIKSFLLPLNGFLPGIYLLRLENESGYKTFKLNIQ